MLTLVKGSCLEQKADVVVNAANPWLMPGRGICGAIFAKADADALCKACQAHADQMHPMPIGSAVITDGFGVGFSKIVHAVGPDFRNPDARVTNLCDAYANAMQLAWQSGANNISFPLISSGIYAGNRFANIYALSAIMAVLAYERFLSHNAPAGAQLEVYLCAYTDEEYKGATLGYDFMMNTVA